MRLEGHMKCGYYPTPESVDYWQEYFKREEDDLQVK